MFDFGAGELLGLAILAMLLVGPDRLPKVAVEAAQWVKKLRGLAGKATTELRDNLGPGFEDLQPKDLNPRTFAMLIGRVRGTGRWRSVQLRVRQHLCLMYRAQECE